MIATHSTELITEADADELLVISKKFRSAKRIKNPSQLQEVFHILGSNLNPILTQLAKTRRALFVEGKDFQIISRFAQKLRLSQVANRSDFAVIPVEGFNPKKVKDFVKGIETTLGVKVLAGTIFDRDYRSDKECKRELANLNKYCSLAHIHDRKEIENFLLVCKPLSRAIERRLAEQKKRTGSELSFEEDVKKLLISLTDTMKNKIQAKYLAKRRPFEKSIAKGLDDSTIDEHLMSEFDSEWSDQDRRLMLIPGKETLAELNRYLQSKYSITISHGFIVSCFHLPEIPSEMITLIERIEEFRMKSPDLE